MGLQGQMGPDSGELRRREGEGPVVEEERNGKPVTIPSPSWRICLGATVDLVGATILSCSLSLSHGGVERRGPKGFFLRE